MVKAYLKVSLPKTLRRVKSRSTFWPIFLPITPGMVGSSVCWLAVLVACGSSPLNLGELRVVTKMCEPHPHTPVKQEVSREVDPDDIAYCW
jgi:hypothetical protein